MNVNLYISDDSKNSSIVEFCKNSKKILFNFYSLRDLKKRKNQYSLIILKDNLSFNSFFKKNLFLIKDSLDNFCLFTPFSVKTADINIKAINYPIKFVDFENNISKIFSIDKYIYLNLELKFDNTLNNINNNKQVHLTEIESKIIKLLFNKLNVDKKLLNKQVLLQSSSIDSKSIESHLYRLRKKLYQIDKKVKIISTSNQCLKIS